MEERNYPALMPKQKPNGLEENGAKLNSAEIEERFDIITSLIAKTRRQLGYNPLPPAELDQWTTDWAEVLMVVPTSELMPACTKAMQSHRSGPFAAWEICEAWEDTRQKRQQKNLFNKSGSAAPVSGYCSDCGNSGWRRLFDVERGLEVSGVAPCRCGAKGNANYSGGDRCPAEAKAQIDRTPKGMAWPSTREEDWLQ